MKSSHTLVTVVALTVGFIFFSGNFNTSNTIVSEANVSTQTLAINKLIIENQKLQLNSGSVKNLTHLTLPQAQVIKLTGVVDERSLDIAKAIVKAGRGNKPIYLLIDSPGGSVLDGAQIVSAMQSSKVPVYTVCTGLCASMAAMIHQYGTERYMVDRSIVMFHPASGGLRGTLEEMQSRLGTITKYVYKMDNDISKKLGLSLDDFHRMINSELWLDAEDALSRKFADKIVSVNIPDEEKTITILAPFGDNKKISKDKIDIKWE